MLATGKIKILEMVSYLEEKCCMEDSPPLRGGRVKGLGGKGRNREYIHTRMNVHKDKM
jgi:hypothetical protein